MVFIRGQARSPGTAATASCAGPATRRACGTSRRNTVGNAEFLSICTLVFYMCASFWRNRDNILCAHTVCSRSRRRPAGRAAPLQVPRVACGRVRRGAMQQPFVIQSHCHLSCIKVDFQLHDRSLLSLQARVTDSSKVCAVSALLSYPHFFPP